MNTPTNMLFIVEEVKLSPIGWESIGLTADLTQDFSELELTSSVLEFRGKDKTHLQGIIDDMGIEASIPIEVVIPSDDPLVAPIEEHFILSTVDSLEKGDTFIKFGVMRRYGVDRFMQRANKTTWDIINDETPITGAVKFPYRVIDPTPGDKIAMLSIQAGSALIALYDSTTGLALAIAATIGGISGFAETAAALIIEAARAILLGITLAKTGKDIFRIFFPEQKHLWENKIVNLIRQGCEYLGYTLSSTLLDSYANNGIIGIPILDNNKSLLENVFDDVSYYNEKFPTSQDTIPTLGALITAEKEKLNAEIKIIGQTIYFESEEYFQQNPATNITETLTDQEEYENVVRHNNDESWYLKTISHLTDGTDRYTLDKSKGVAAEYKTVYTGNADEDLVNIEGTPRVNIPYALTRRKEKLSYLDEQAIIFGTIVDTITNTFGNGTNLVNLVKSSVGQMIISSQHFLKTKTTWAVGGKQTEDFIDHIGAKAIYEDRHVNKQVKENKQEIYPMDIAFSVEDFRKIISNKYLSNQDNQIRKMRNYTWMPTDSQITTEVSKSVPELSKTKTVLING